MAMTVDACKSSLVGKSARVEGFLFLAQDFLKRLGKIMLQPAKRLWRDAALATLVQQLPIKERSQPMGAELSQPVGIKDPQKPWNKLWIGAE